MADINLRELTCEARGGHTIYGSDSIYVGKCHKCGTAVKDLVNQYHQNGRIVSGMMWEQVYNVLTGR